MTTPADKAIEQAKKDAEAAQTAAASDAVNPAKPEVAQAKPVVAPPKIAVTPLKPAPKLKVSIVEIRFNEGMRDVEVRITQDQGTMTPRKIEHATYVLMKKFREHLGQIQAAAARAQRAAEAKLTDVSK